MKKYLFPLLLGLVLISCKEEKTRNKSGSNPPTEKTVKKQSKTFVIDSLEIRWTAYKTTKKIPVNGTFKNTEWKNILTAGSPEKCLEKLYFKTVTPSVFTANPERDRTIYEYLFGKMLEGNVIEGRMKKIIPGRNYMQIFIRMNGIEKQIDFHYRKTGHTLTAEAVIDLTKDFQAGEALYFLHTACEDKHTGPDGISKTWPDVKLEAIIKFHEIQS
jgi:hypothetical protein